MELSKKKIIISIVFFIVAFLAFLFFFPGQILGIFFRDIKPIDDSDLTFEKMVVPQEQNAYYDLEEANSKAYWPEGSTEKYKNCLEGENCDETFLKEINDKNQESFSLIKNSLEKPFFVCPELEDPDKIADLKTVAYSWSNILYLEPVKILYLSKQGKDKEAFDEAIMMFSLNEKIKEGRPSPLRILESFASDGLTVRSANFAAANSDLSSADLLQYSEKLAGIKDDGTEAIVLAIGKINYLMMRNLVDDLSSGKLLASDLLSIYSIGEGDGVKADPGSEKIFTDKFYFQPNRTKDLLAQEARKVIEATEASCDSSLLSDSLIRKVQTLAFGPGTRFYPNYGGLVVYSMPVALKTVRITSCKSRSQLVIIRYLLALKAYKQDNGQLPDSLEKLVPDYLPELPKDPFSGGALKYSLEKKIIYSVGQNGSDQDLVDDGGDEEKDIVMSIDF